MANKNFLKIKSPVGGTVRSTAYQDQPPFTNYASINMWPVDVLTDRNVVATRPPLASITSPTGPCTMLCRVNGFATSKPYQSMIGGFNSDVYYWSGTAWTAATGAQASDIPTTRAVYAATYLEDVFICQTNSKPLVFDYDAATVTTLVETDGTAPSDCRFNTVWQGAVWYSGQLSTPHLLHSSRVGFPLDFDSSADVDDIGAAFTTTSSENEGKLNGPVTALMPQTSDVMIVSTIEGLVAMRGHPRNNGIFDPIDGTHYVLGHGAWCKAPGDFLFMLNPLGLAVLPPGVNQVVTQLSRKKIPSELVSLEYDYDDPKVAMCYDSRWNGIHITVRGKQQQAWFYDLSSGGFHRMEFTGYPFVLMEFPPFATESTNGVLYGGTLLRHMDKFGSENIESSITVGPVQLTENAMTKGRIDRARIVLARDTPNASTECTMAIATGTDGQDSIARVESGLQQYQVGLDVVKNFHGMCLPQASGHAATFSFQASSGNFGIEEIELVVAPAGWNKMVRAEQTAIEGDESDFSAPDDEFDDDEWHGYSEATPNTPDCTLTDHSLFIDLSRLPDEWWDAANPIGGDVRATNNTNDQIPIDVVYFDKIAKTGFAVVKITQQDPPTPVRLWVGNPDVGPEDADSTFGRHNAYDSNWIAFWPSGGAFGGGEDDRTTNDNDITLVNQVTSSNLVTGTIGVQATDYVAVDTTNNYGIANAVVPGTYPVTLIVVAKDEDNTTLPCLGVRNSGTTANLELTCNRTASLQRADAGATDTAATAAEAQSTDVANASTFRHFAGVIEDADSRAAFIDGGNKGTNSTTITIAASSLNEIIIGKGARSAISAGSTSADLCLAQVHNVARADCWIDYQAEMLDQDDFWDDWSDFEAVNPPDDDEDAPTEVGTWSGYAEATPIKPAATMPSWVHWIDLSRLPSEWWSAVSTTGVDIRATNSANRFIPLDLVEFNKTDSTGFACVKLTQGETQAQAIRLWVGNSSAITIAATDSYGQYNVYDGGWKGFWPKGSGNDRTRNANHITLVSATSGGATGPIGNTATTYDGTDDYGYVTPSVAGRIPPNEPFMISAVVKPANITSKMASVSLNRLVFLGHSTLVHDISSTPVMLEVRADSQIAVATSDVTVTPASGWYHTAGWARDNRRRGCIVSGDGPDEASETSIQTHDYTRLSIGARLSGTEPVVYWPFNGDISLVHCQNTIRALDNSWADYQHEMLTQSTFWDTDWAWTADSDTLPQS